MSNKVRRNDKCPCGSKLKYKKCCLESKIFETRNMNETASYQEDLDEILNNAVGYMDHTMDEPIFF